MTDTDSGRLPFGQDLGQDPSKHKQTEESLRATEERLRLALEAAHIGTFDWDVITNRLISSHWYEELWGFKSGEFNGANDAFFERVHPEDRGNIGIELSRCMAARTPFIKEFRVVWPDGSLHWLLIRGEFSFDASGLPLQLRGVVMDTTDRKQREEALREATQRAKDSSQTKSNFLANMSHEVRTPLNAIIGMTFLALRASPSPRQARYLTKIKNAAESLRAITNDILDFSKIEAGKMELEHIPFQLGDVLSNLNDVVIQRAEQKSLAIVFSVAPDVPYSLIGDPLRLGQILINLLNNAIKFTEVGQIVLKVMAELISSEQGAFTFSISDTGIGMSAEQISHLFQSFNQADTSFTRKYGGTGLGLAISRQLCELMNGSLTVESEIAKGSTFLLKVPLGIAPSHSPVRDGQWGFDLRKSVLVVDHEEDSRIELINMLCENGFVATSAASDWEALIALASASQSGKPFDLVIIDWRSPGGSGGDASRRIKSHMAQSRTPAILLISASEREEVTASLPDPSLNAFLLKPVGESLLMDAIASIFESRSHEVAVGPLHPVVPDSKMLSGRKILLVEDNEINRDLVVELLEDLGITVEIAVNGLDGVNRVFGEPFDLVLMDVQMPVMDGLEAARLIRADRRYAALPILAMTAHAMRADEEKSLLSGMNAHLTKPINPREIVDALVRWMPARHASSARFGITSAAPNRCLYQFPLSLPPFDIQAALVRTNGKPQLLSKIMSAFRDKYETADTDLRRLVAAGQLEEAERLSHSLKSLAATLAATTLAEAASEIEQAFRTGQTTHLAVLFDALGKELGPAIDAINSLEIRAT